VDQAQLIASVGVGVLLGEPLADRRDLGGGVCDRRVAGDACDGAQVASITLGFVEGL
jgi:hypothetical protein